MYHELELQYALSIQYLLSGVYQPNEVGIIAVPLLQVRTWKLKNIITCPKSCSQLSGKAGVGPQDCLPAGLPVWCCRMEWFSQHWAQCWYTGELLSFPSSLAGSDNCCSSLQTQFLLLWLMIESPSSGISDDLWGFKGYWWCLSPLTTGGCVTATCPSSVTVYLGMKPPRCLGERCCAQSSQSWDDNSWNKQDRRKTNCHLKNEL